MATFTVTTNKNIDELAGKTGGDTYDIYDALLTIDQDSRYGLNQSPSTSLGTTSQASGYKASVLIDGRKVRLIPFINGSGTLPALGSTISQGSASGKLIAVWSALNAAPVTSGSMPATGWIKIKQWNDIPFVAGALSGITADATGPDVVGWIEVVGDANAILRLSFGGRVDILGEWYEVGVTTGERTSTYQIPTSGSNTQVGGVWVETGAGTGVYDRYPNIIGTLGATTVATDAVRGKWCYIGLDGVLRLGSDGTNTSGYCPVAGCKIRIGNVILQSCATATRTNNIGFTSSIVYNTYYRLDGDKDLYIDKATLGIQIHNTYTTNYIDIKNSSVIQSFRLGSRLPPKTSNVIVGSVAVDTAVLFLFHGELTDFTAAAYKANTSWWSVYNIDNATKLSIKNMHIAAIVPRTTTNRPLLTIIRATDFEIDGLTLGGGPVNTNTTAGSNTIKNVAYYDNVQGEETSSSYGCSAVEIGATTQNLLVDGISFPAGENSHCYGGVVRFMGTFCSDVKIRNIGSPANHLNLGTVNICAAAWEQTSNLNMCERMSISRVYTTPGRNAAINVDYSQTNFTYKSVFIGYKTIRAGRITGNLVLAEAANHYSALEPATGTHFIALFTSATTGTVELLTNPVTDESSSYFITEGAVHDGDTYYTLTEGLYGYVQIEPPHWFRGYTAISSITQDTWPYDSGTISIEYQIDTGSGFSGWKAASLLSGETIDPTIGFRIKTRTTSITSGRTRAGKILLNMVTTAEAQLLALYPLDVSTLKINDMVSGSMVKVTKTSDNSVLYTGTANQVDIEYAGKVRVVIRKGTGSPAYKQWDTITTLVSDQITEITALQELDE